MHLKNTILGSLLAVLAFTSACDAPPTEKASASTSVYTSAILGGVPAGGRNLDAVGSLGAFDENGNYAPLCTATLIGPRSIITAKHCAVAAWDYTVRMMDHQPMYFSIGANPFEPLERIEVSDVAISPVTDGGIVAFEQGFGNDVAVYTLVQAATKATPLPVRSTSLGEADFSETFLSIGYGVSETPNGEALTYGVRRSGPAQLGAIEGLFFEHIYGGLEEYLTHEAAQWEPGAWEHIEPLFIPNYWESDLLPEYDAWVKPVPPLDAQPCFGDSGSPLLHSRNSNGRSQFEVAGVVSGGESDAASGKMCAFGTWYATFGPETRAFIQATVDAAQN